MHRIIGVPNGWDAVLETKKIISFSRQKMA